MKVARRELLPLQMTPSSAHELRRQLERIAGHVQDLEAACIKDAASKKQRQSRRGRLPRLVKEKMFSRLDAAPGHALPPPYAFMNHAKVVVVGLGNLGSTIAQNLAQSGCRFIRCVDSVVVVDADLGSCLGIEHLGERRSEAVARALSSAPDASGMSSSFMAFNADTMDQLVQVITGLPAGGREEGEEGPAVYGWIERPCPMHVHSICAHLKYSNRKSEKTWLYLLLKRSSLPQDAERSEELVANEKIFIT